MRFRREEGQHAEQTSSLRARPYEKNTQERTLVKLRAHKEPSRRALKRYSEDKVRSVTAKMRIFYSPYDPLLAR